MAEMDWSSRLEHERLILSAPEVVYDQLSKLAPADFWNQNIEARTVHALLDRNSPLIDLAIARFCSPPGPLEMLFSRGGILRLGVLANRNANEFPAAQIYGAALNGSEEELAAIAGNPGLSGQVLASLISNEMKDGKLDDARWQLVVECASKNPRVSQIKDDDDTFDDFTSSLEFNRPLAALWALLKTAPPTERWAGTLWNAFARVPYPESYISSLAAEEVPTLLTERWATPSSGADQVPINYAGLREAVAAQVLLGRSYDRRLAEALRDHPDVALRRAFYSGTDIYGELDVEACWQHDRAAFIETVIVNKSLYRRRNHKIQSEVRARLQIVLKENSHLDYLHRTWRAMAERMAEKDPEVYGPDPTPEMVRSDKEWAEAQERMASWKTQNEPLTQAPVRHSFSLTRFVFRWFWAFMILAILLALWLDGRGG